MTVMYCPFGWKMLFVLKLIGFISFYKFPHDLGELFIHLFMQSIYELSLYAGSVLGSGDIQWRTKETKSFSL